MKALEVDFRIRRSPPRWAWIFVGLVIVAAISLGLAARWELRLRESLQTERDEIRRQVATPSPEPVITVPRMPYDTSAREMLALASSQWPVMLTALESVEIVGVYVVAIEISPAERWIRAEVEFAEFPALLSFVDGLNGGEPVVRWSLVQAQSGTRSSTGANGALSTATVRVAW